MCVAPGCCRLGWRAGAASRRPARARRLSLFYAWRAPPLLGRRHGRLLWPVALQLVICFFFRAVCVRPNICVGRRKSRFVYSGRAQCVVVPFIAAAPLAAAALISQYAHRLVGNIWGALKARIHFYYSDYLQVCKWLYRRIQSLLYGSIACKKLSLPTVIFFQFIKCNFIFMFIFFNRLFSIF